MKSFFIAALFLLFCTSLPAQQENWEQQQKRQKEEWDRRNRQEKQAWDKQNEAERQQWQDMVDRESTAWKAHVADIKKKWSDEVFSDVKNWVGYSDNNLSRFQTDFEKGNLRIEVLGAANDSPNLLQQRAKNILKQLQQAKSAVNEPPILDSQLAIKTADSQIPANLITQQSYTSPDGQRLQKMIVNIPFRKNHLRIRAERILPMVQKYSQKYRVNPKLVMAVIHTESAFNPKAISTFSRGRRGIGHAYGLMQLVPYSGGKEAYQLIGGFGEPSPAMLFNPENNIELGVVYLYRLGLHHFAQVTDEQNRQYLMTAAYNTGPQNVAIALVGKRDLRAAIPVINSLHPDRLYNHLIYKLPYKQTRDYLQKVTERMRLY